MLSTPGTQPLDFYLYTNNAVGLADFSLCSNIRCLKPELLCLQQKNIPPARII